MKNLLKLALLLPMTMLAQAPQIPLTGNIGSGFNGPLINSPAVVFATDADHTMVYPEMSGDGGTLILTSSVTLTATRNLIAPTTGNFNWVVRNNTTGGQSINVKVAGGTGVSIANGNISVVMCDTINCYVPGGQNVTQFLAPTASWPSWLVPSVTNQYTTPSLAVTAAYTPLSAVTGTAPVVATPSGSTVNISMPVATSSVDGYLSHIDWAAFNAKQNALTNPVTGTGSGGTTNDLACVGNSSVTSMTDCGIAKTNVLTTSSSVFNGVTYPSSYSQYALLTAPTTTSVGNLLPSSWTTGHTFVPVYQPTGSAIAPSIVDASTLNVSTATNLSTNGMANQVWSMNSGATAQGWQTPGSTMTYPGANTLGVANSGNTAWRTPLFSDITGLFGSGSCSGLLKSDGTCVLASTLNVNSALTASNVQCYLQDTCPTDSIWQAPWTTNGAPDLAAGYPLGASDTTMTIVTLAGMPATGHVVTTHGEEMGYSYVSSSGGNSTYNISRAKHGTIAAPVSVAVGNMVGVVSETAACSTCGVLVQTTNIGGTTFGGQTNAGLTPTVAGSYAVFQNLNLLSISGGGIGQFVNTSVGGSFQASGYSAGSFDVSGAAAARQAAYTNLTSIGSLSNAAGWLHNDGSGNFAYSTPSGYSLPIATTSTLGGVKPDGTNCSVNGSTGVLTCAGTYVSPLTLAPQSTGFTIAGGTTSKTLTVAANINTGTTDGTLGSAAFTAAAAYATAAQGTKADNAGAVTGAVKSNGSATFGQAACGDLSNGASGCSTTVGTAATHAATDFQSALNGTGFVKASGTSISYDNSTYLTSSGVSGMTTGQVPIAATATTITSSKALAGSGSGITTGPTSSTSGDLMSFTGTGGQSADSGILASSVLTSLSGALLATGATIGATSQAQVFTDGLQLDNTQLNTPKSMNFAANTTTGANYGSINWYNYQWDTYVRASINAQQDSYISNGRLVFSTSPGGSDAVPQMTILGGGNVGIGTTNPAALLSVGSSNQFTVDSSGNFSSTGYGKYNTVIPSSGHFYCINYTQTNCTTYSGGAGFMFDVQNQIWGGTYGVGGSFTIQGNSPQNSTTGGFTFFGGSIRGDAQQSQAYMGSNSTGNPVVGSATGVLVDGTAGGHNQNYVGVGYTAGSIVPVQFSVNGSSYFGGNVSIGDTTAAAMFNVGTANQFQVSSTGVSSAGAGSTDYSTASSAQVAHCLADGTGGGVCPASAAQTTVSCSTAGTATFSEPFTGTSYKKVIYSVSGCQGTVSYTFPVAFTTGTTQLSPAGGTNTVTNTSITWASISALTAIGVIEGW